MTKAEIILETIEHVHKNGRSIDREACKYLSDDGNQCAIGRCMDMRKYSKNMEGMGVTRFNGDKLDYYLRKKYHGHDGEFWAGLQKLHDLREYWINADGPFPVLDENGKIRARALAEEDITDQINEYYEQAVQG